MCASDEGAPSHRCCRVGLVHSHQLPTLVLDSHLPSQVSLFVLFSAWQLLQALRTGQLMHHLLFSHIAFSQGPTQGAGAAAAAAGAGSGSRQPFCRVAADEEEQMGLEMGSFGAVVVGGSSSRAGSSAMLAQRIPSNALLAQRLPSNTHLVAAAAAGPDHSTMPGSPSRRPLLQQ